MESATLTTAQASDPWRDTLVPVLHRIARRADQLWQQRGPVHQSDLDCWLRAEREVFGEDDVISAAGNHQS